MIERFASNEDADLKNGNVTETSAGSLCCFIGKSQVGTTGEKLASVRNSGEGLLKITP